MSKTYRQQWLQNQHTQLFKNTRIKTSVVMYIPLNFQNVCISNLTQPVKVWDANENRSHENLLNALVTELHSLLAIISTYSLSNIVNCWWGND